MHPEESVRVYLLRGDVPIPSDALLLLLSAELVATHAGACGLKLLAHAA
jgi:hypothetical protein